MCTVRFFRLKVIWLEELVKWLDYVKHVVLYPKQHIRLVVRVSKNDVSAKNVAIYTLTIINDRQKIEIFTNLVTVTMKIVN